MRFIFICLLVFIASYAFWGIDQRTTSDREFLLRLPDDVSQENKLIIKKSIEIFFKACPKLKGYWLDIDSVSADPYIDAGGEFEYRTEQYGWQHWIHVTMQVSDNPKNIPNRIRAAGHTLHYNLGGGVRPGIIFKKKQSGDVCGISMRDDGADGFIEIPDLNIVDSLK